MHPKQSQGHPNAKSKSRVLGTGWVRGKRNPEPGHEAQARLCTVHSTPGRFEM